MTIKKKLLMGSVSAALGLSLVAGGTWAAFNDVESSGGSFAAGTLKLDLAEHDGPYTFEVSNLKPGDHMTRDIMFVNRGSLAIKEVIAAIESVDFENEDPDQPGESGYGDAWVDQANEDVLAYLDQFRVTMIALGAEGGGDYDKDLLGPEDNVTLKDFYLASDSIYGKSEDTDDIKIARNKIYNVLKEKEYDNYFRGNRLNVTTETNDKWEGLPINPKDWDVLRLKIEFIDNTEEMLVVDGVETAEYWQNIFQGNFATLTFSFEATQWDGQEITDSDLEGEGKPEGYIYTNEQAENGE